MATYTENYNLKKPGENDNALISDINENMDTIDGELKKRIAYSGGKLPTDAVPILYKELARFTTDGTFAPSDHRTIDGRYDIVLQGGGGSGAYASEANVPWAGESGAFVSITGAFLRSGAAYTVTIGKGGEAVTSATYEPAYKGKAGGATKFAGFSAPGGQGGTYGTQATMTATVSNGYEHNLGDKGGTGYGGASLFASGGASNKAGKGGDGSIGSGGGTGYTTGYTSGKGGDGIVIIYGWVLGR